MEDELFYIIKLYQQTVKELFSSIAAYLNISLPITNVEWSGLDFPDLSETPDGIKYLAHGFGIVMKKDDWVIDFDLGDNGEIDGFSADCLWKFIKSKKIQTLFIDENAVRAEIDIAVERGKVIYSGYILYYLKS